MRTQSRKVEMIDNLFKLVPGQDEKMVDEGIFRSVSFLDCCDVLVARDMAAM